MTMTDDLLRPIIDEFDAIEVDRNQPLLVAFSGGLDSSVLVDLLCRFHNRGGPPLELIHVDHGLRQSSKNDAQFCEAEARRRKLPLKVERLSFENNTTGQHGARRKRIAVIAEYAISRGIRDVVFAHHGDDRIESFLFHLQRGTGLDGLVPMTKKGPYPFYGGILDALRPLLSFTRAQLEAYSQRFDIAFITDPTNATDAYSRNRIRHHVVPELAADPQRRQKLLTSFANLESEQRAATYYADELARHSAIDTPGIRNRAFRRSILADAPMATVVRIFSDLEPTLDAPSLHRIYNTLCTSCSSTTHLTLSRCVITISGDRVVYQPSRSRGGSDVLRRVAHPVGISPFAQGVAPFFGAVIRWSLKSKPNRESTVDDRWTAHFDPRQLVRPIKIAGPPRGAKLRRLRHDGDVYHQKLSKIFSSCGVDADLRWRWPCLIDAEDKLIWAIGLHRGATALSAPGSKLRWRLQVWAPDHLTEFLQQ